MKSDDDMLAYGHLHIAFQQSIRFWESAINCAWLNPNTLDARIAEAIKAEIRKYTPPSQGQESAFQEALEEDTERQTDKWRRLQ